MDRRDLFSALVAIAACSSTPPPPVQPPAPVDAAPVELPADAPVDAPAASARGGACGAEQACADGLTCLAASAATPGGACVSACSACGDGACVPTALLGPLCVARCTSDADCRTREGYVCDPRWHACAMPNIAVIVPQACPSPAKLPARDPSFGAVTTLAPGRAPAAAIAPGGALFALVASDGRLVGATAQRSSALAIATSPGEPSLARDAKGILYAAWLDAPAESAPQILLARSRDGGATWSVPDRADDPADCAGRARCLGAPTVVVGPNPEQRGAEVVYVLYGAADGVRVRASRDEGASFRAAVTALPGTVASAQVAADGALHVIAIDAVSAPPSLGPARPTDGPVPLGAFGAADHRIVYAASRDVGRTFARPVRLDRRDELLPVYFARPQLAVDTPRRLLYALYVRGGRDAVWDLVLLASRDGGATWKRTRIGDDPACAMHALPQLALDPRTGTLHLAWYDNRGGGRFAHATCTSGATRCTQLGAINAAPFALTAERLSPAWLGEQAALVVDDARRTLHAVWTRPGDGGPRVEHAAAKLR